MGRPPTSAGLAAVKVGVLYSAMPTYTPGLVGPQPSGGASFWEGVKRTFRRIARSDFQTERATESERQRLRAATPPIENGIAQDYAAWRRSVLLVATSTLAINAVIALVGHSPIAESLNPRIVQAIGAGNFAVVDWLLRSTLIALVAGTVLVFAAAVTWRRLRTSTILARVGWLVMFTTPFVLAAIPFGRLINLDHMTPEAQTALRRALGGLFALGAFFTIAPRALALFPGLIRSSLAVKTLLPEAAAPGWVVVIIAPLYAIFLLVLVTSIIQVQGDFFLLGGVAFMTASPMVYILQRRALIRPQSTAEATRTVSRTKNLAGLLNTAGLALIAVFFLKSAKLEVLDLLSFLTGIVGNVVLLMTVGADFLIGVLRSAHEMGKEFHGSQLQRALEIKIEALTTKPASRGDGGVSSPESPPTPP